MSKTYTPYEVAFREIGAWREGAYKYCDNIDIDDILEIVKDTCKDYGLGMEDVKEIFEDQEYPFTYDICCYDDHVKDIDNQEMEKEWLNSKNQYYYKLHKKWLQDKKQKEVSFNIAISKLKRNKIVNEGILLKLSMKNCGLF